MIDTLRQDLAHALRRLGRSPGSALVAVATLALGIGASTVIFTVVDAVLLRPLPYLDAGRLVAIFAHETRQGAPRNPTSPADFLEWEKASRAIGQLTAAHPWSPVLTGRGHAVQVRGLKATPGLFDLVGVPPALGSTAHDPGDEHQVVLRHSLWQRQFGGDPGIVGQSLVLDGDTYRIAAVMPPGFRFPPFWATNAEMWVPLVLRADQAANHAQFLRVFGRLGPGASVEKAQAEMDVVAARLASEWPESNAGVGVNVERLQEPVVSRARPALLLLAGAVALVLLIACANVTCLLLAQGMAREKEAAIRAALGANRARLVRQRLVESVVVSLAGGAGGLGLAGLILSVVERLVPAGLPRLEEIGMDGRVAVFALTLSVVTGVVSGLIPALHSSRPDLVPSLKQGERSSSGGGRQRLQDLLVVAEFTMAVVLLVGAGLLIQSFLALQRQSTGFRSDGLLTLTLSLSGSEAAGGERRPAFLDEVADAVSALPDVETAALVNHVPIGGDTWRTRLSVEGRPAPGPNDLPRAVMRTVTAAYPAAMGLPIRRGRAFDEGDRAGSPPVVLVNETLARQLWPDTDPIGARVRLGGVDSDGPWRTIVGVVADSVQSSVTEPIQPEMLFPYAQDPVDWFDGTTLVVRARSEPRALAETVAARVRATALDVPITRVQTMPELLSEALARERSNTLLLGLLTALAIALAAGGVFSVTAHAVGRRTHEIGVRMALGAGAGEVQAMVLRHALRLALVGGALGLLGAGALSPVLRGLLHGVSPTDPVTFAAVGLLLLAVAGLAAFLPARRAAKLDPAVVLRGR